MDKPSEQRGGTQPDDDEARAKGPWAETAQEGVVPPELGGADARDELLGEDPQLGGAATGRPAESEAPATESGIDSRAGDAADAVTDGGAEPPVGAEPDLKDVGAAQREEQKGE
jgi:hypothetical protein